MSVERFATEAELIEGFGLDIEAEASMITDVVFSVIRDMAVSSLYGYRSYKSSRYPSAYEVFLQDYATRITTKVKGYAEEVNNVPLYSGAGELLGQLARVLMVCKERSGLSEYIHEADSEISRLGIEVEYVHDGEYVRHLRNAVMHCRYEVILDPNDPLRTKVRFLDLRYDRDNRCKRISGLMTLTPEQISGVIEILIESVCLRYLSSIGWSFI